MCCKPSGDYTICRKHTWNGFLSPLRDFIVCLETRGWWWLLWEWRCCRCMWVAAVCLTLITANSRHSKTRYMALHLVMKGGPEGCVGFQRDIVLFHLDARLLFSIELGFSCTALWAFWKALGWHIHAPLRNNCNNIWFLCFSSDQIVIYKSSGKDSWWFSFIPRLTNTKALWSMVRVQRPHLVFDFDWYWMIWAQGQRTTPLFRLDWLQRPATHQMTSGYSIQ